MNLLVLGGTGWLGPKVVQAALDRSVDVTCLTRGHGTVPEGAQSVQGDRTRSDGYDAVTGREWDLVLDTTWQPGMARSAVAALASKAGAWAFVSSTGVYADYDGQAIEEDAETVPPLDADSADNEHYPQAKAACEAAVTDALGDRALIARSGLLVGPGDPSDRFGYWVGRFALAGDGPVLAPDVPDQPVQMCDPRDLGTWLVEALIAGRSGIFNAVGPTWTFAEILEAAQKTAEFTGELVRVSEQWLGEHGVKPWLGPHSLPLWQPEWYDAGAPLLCDDRRIRATGARYRSIDEITGDTLEFEREQGLERDRQAGLTREEELDLIEQARQDGAK